MPLINRKRFDEAVALHEGGELDKAEALYKGLLAKTPKHPDLLQLYGVLQAQLGNPAQAIELVSAAIRLRPNKLEYQENLAAAYNEAGDRAAAAAIMVQVGNRHLTDQRYEDAIRVYGEALEVEPGNLQALSNTGVALTRMQRPAEALPWFQRALAIDSDFADALLNLGNVLWSQGDHAGAIALYQRAATINPLSEIAQINLAFAANALGKVSEAVTYYDRAVELKPDFARAHHDRGMALLSQGCFSEGFTELEWRWAADYEYAEPRRPYKQPVWNGGKLKGSLLLFQEQGFGDAILLTRFLPELADRGFAVILETRAPLYRLFQASFADVPGLSIVHAPSGPAPGKPSAKRVEFAAYAGLFSVPARLGISRVSPEPYLKPDADLVASWTKQLPPDKPDTLRVGIVWAGEPRANDPTGSLLDRQRSLTLTQFFRFLDMDGLTLVSLQKGQPSEQLGHMPNDFTIHDPMPGVKDFADTAAIIANLDLVITVDTSVANLAGAMGKPVWVLVRLNTDWRWMDKGDATPWYPAARIFRQRTLGDWSPVLDDVRQALKQLTSPN